MGNFVGWLQPIPLQNEAEEKQEEKEEKEGDNNNLEVFPRRYQGRPPQVGDIFKGLYFRELFRGEPVLYEVLQVHEAERNLSCRIVGHHKVHGTLLRSFDDIDTYKFRRMEVQDRDVAVIRNRELERRKLRQALGGPILAGSHYVEADKVALYRFCLNAVWDLVENICHKVIPDQKDDDGLFGSSHPCILYLHWQRYHEDPLGLDWLTEFQDRINCEIRQVGFEMTHFWFDPYNANQLFLSLEERAIGAEDEHL